MKPGNIFLIKDIMQIKIGDFGLACTDLISNTQIENLNNITEKVPKKSNDTYHEHTAGVGTSLYSSPEQLNMKSYDYRVQILKKNILSVVFYLIFLY
jgi:eukaryotic translation initiation factor 2-alpha kinase 1